MTDELCQDCRKEYQRCRSSGVEIYPSFIVGRSKDMMVRGKAFYAIWDDAKGL